MRIQRLSPRLLTILSILVLMIGVSWTATGQEKPKTETAPPPPAPTPFPLSIGAVTTTPVGLGDELTVEVINLTNEINRQQNSSVAAQDRLAPNKLVLFLNNLEVKNLLPRPEGDKLHYTLQTDENSRDVWNSLLARPKSKFIEIPVSVGLAGKGPISSDKKVQLRLYDRILLSVCVVGFALLLIGFFVAAAKTAILRDPDPPNPEGGPLKRPYSLGRTQMAWWFFIILGSFVFIAVITWNLDTITGSSLVLLGIGSATALGGAMVDANKRENSNNDLAAFAPQQAKLEGLIDELNAKITTATANLAANADPNGDPAIMALRTELATRESDLDQVKAKIDAAAAGLEKPVSEGFILDLLTDVNGVTVHRFQIVVWTLVLSFIFVVMVFNTLKMPTFSEMILGLMGISAGTFIGFKIPEKQTKPSDAKP